MPEPLPRECGTLRITDATLGPADVFTNQGLQRAFLSLPNISAVVNTKAIFKEWVSDVQSIQLSFGLQNRSAEDMPISLRTCWALPMLLLQLAAFLHLVSCASLINSQLNTPRSNSSITLNTTESANGTGLAYAQGCQAELFAWSKASSSYGLEHGHNSTSLYSSHMTVKSIVSATTKASGIITLCDGYPRVVGQVSSSNGSTITSGYTWTNTNPTFVPASYPTPAPCSIGPEDCASLWSSVSARYDAKTGASGGDVFQAPPCTTRTVTQSYSTNAQGGQCDNCQVIGSQIRLLYWPIITSPGPGNLCNKTASTVTVAPTGEGPNTYVTDGITITSPSVAVSIGGVSRVDGCGPTIAHTIIAVPPSAVSSVRGARALFTHEPFNFADLNYRCLSDPDKIYVTTGDRNDCYQEVPASAYFYGHQNAAGVDWYNPSAFANSTIWPNYQPQVLPPQTMMEAIRSVWGSDCNIHPDGVWDPPIALTSANSIPLPKSEPGAPAQYATATSNLDPAMPAAPTHAQVTKISNGWGPATAETQGSLETPTAPSNHQSFGMPSGHSKHDDHPVPSVADESSTIHIVHITTYTKPSLDGPSATNDPTNPSQDGPVYTMKGEHFTQTVISDATILANDQSTITLAADDGISNAIVQPFRGPNGNSGSVVTVQGLEYTVQTEGSGGFKLEGDSTTISISELTTDSTASKAIESAATSSNESTRSATSTDAASGTSRSTQNTSSDASGRSASSPVTSDERKVVTARVGLAFLAALTAFLA